jgi:hypothetical protein
VTARKNGSLNRAAGIVTGPGGIFCICGHFELQPRP